MRWLLAIAIPLLLLETPALADRSTAQAALAEGQAALARGHARAAQVSLAKAIKADPDWAPAHAAQGDVYVRLGKSKAALTEFERALQLGINPVLINHLVAQVWLLNNDPQRALIEAGNNRVAPAFATDASRVRAKALTMLGDLGGAGRELDAAAASSPDNAEVWADITRFRLNAVNIAGAYESGVRAAALGPQNPGILLLMARLMRDRYGPRAALPWVERATAIDPADIGALRDLAAIQGDTGQTVAMLATARKMLVLEKNNADALYFIAVIAARAGDHALALRLFYRTGGRLDQVPAVALFAGALSLEEGNNEQAITYLTMLVDVQPANLEARRLLATAYLRMGDSQSALDAIGGFANAAGSDSYSLALIGRSYEAMGDRAAAASYLDRAASPVRSDPAPFGMSFDLAIITRGRAPNDAEVAVPRISQMIADGKAAEALDQARTLQEANPGVPAAHMLLGDVLMAMGNPADAVATYQRAADISYLEPIVLRLIDACRRAGRMAEADRYLDIYLQQNPRNIAALLLASDRFVRRGLWDPAERLLTGLRIRLGNGNGAILDNLGWVWFNKGDPDRALEAASAAFALSPSNSAYSGNYGWLLYKTGRDKKTGARLLKKAVALAPQHAGFNYQLAQVLIDAGQKQAARPHLELAAQTSDFADQAKAAALLAGL